jgi:bifunctional NMN adenylyltransferase/nudix hydrolase
MIKSAVYIGRFSPIHKAHIETIRKGLEVAETVFVLVGSSNASPSIKNPWSFADRYRFLASNFSEFDLKRIRIIPLSDHLYNDNAWVTEVRAKLRDYGALPGEVVLLGADKDESSYYLSLFPGFSRLESVVAEGINATDARADLFRSLLAELEDGIPLSENAFKIDSPALTDVTKEDLRQWALCNQKEAERLTEEYRFINQYRSAWKSAPYPPIFVTTDAVVVCAGHVLMVRRAAEPGKGLLALPGGFVNQNERLEDACLRELREETRIKVPLAVLRGSICANRVFDHPQRSLRGRTITHAYHIALADTDLPKIKGGDDAEKAIWVPLSDIVQNQTVIYEDHAHIIEYFTGITL